jgi:hypothetical protein
MIFGFTFSLEIGILKNGNVLTVGQKIIIYFLLSELQQKQNIASFRQTVLFSRH